MSYVLFIITIPFDESTKAKLDKPITRKDVKEVTKENGTKDEAVVKNEAVEAQLETIIQTPTIVIEDVEENNSGASPDVKFQEAETESKEPEEEKEDIVKEVKEPKPDDAANTKTTDDDTQLSKKPKTPPKLQKGMSYYDLTKVCQSILKKHKVLRPAWMKTEGGSHWKIMCHVRQNQVDDTLNSLLVAGIGNNGYSSISILPVTIHFPSMVESESEEESSEENDEGENSSAEKKTALKKEKKEKNEFFQTVKSRMNVAQVVSAVRNGSQLTFDYVMLLVLAGMIAAVGLMENSSVLLVASMLVSPLMGPILGGTFGLVLQHKRVWKPAVINELIGLSICLGCGFFFGLFVFLGGISNWDIVTDEMKGRGQARGLVIGVLIAIPSGAAVALSILGGNIGSLVGVAISASLLPPAVNAGMFWAFAIVCSIGGQPQVNSKKILHHEPSELARLGAISVTLTLVNIIIIFVMGVLILKVKEVAPKTASAVTAKFWKRDIRTARRNLKDNDRTLEEGALKDFIKRKHPDVDFSNTETILDPTIRQDVQKFNMKLNSIEKDAEYINLTNRLPIKPSSRSSTLPLLDFNPRFKVHSVNENLLGAVPTETTFVKRFTKTKLDIIDSTSQTGLNRLGNVSSTETVKKSPIVKKKEVSIQIDDDVENNISNETNEKEHLL